MTNLLINFVVHIKWIEPNLYVLNEYLQKISIISIADLTIYTIQKSS